MSTLKDGWIVGSSTWRRVSSKQRCLHSRTFFQQKQCRVVKVEIVLRGQVVYFGKTCMFGNEIKLERYAETWFRVVLNSKDNRELLKLDLMRVVLGKVPVTAEKVC